MAILQRVSSSTVYIKNQKYSSINKGILILLGIGKDDGVIDIQFLIDKIIHLRIFNDDSGKMNLSILDIKGEILVVSQFTLFANLNKGRRPSFIDSGDPIMSKKLYNNFIDEINQYGLNIQSGKFGSMMNVNLENHGPATFILNSKN